MTRSSTTWFGVITRPAGHFVATSAVNLLIVGATVLSVLQPTYAMVILAVAAVPAGLWYRHMMKQWRASRPAERS